MKNLIFKEVSLLSFREKKARRISFHPRLTVIKGENDTGKSALTKCLYRTLGAEPHQIHPAWEEANVSSLLTFDLDGEVFSMLRSGTIFCLFDKSGKVIKHFTSVTKELAPFFANLFNFRLPLSLRGQQAQATPAFLFLPFYFDQDRSWQEQWKGFARLQQFSNWKSDLIAFHCGIRPTEYYQAKSKKWTFEIEQKDCLSNREVISSTLDKIKEQLRQVCFDVSIDDFKEEIEELLRRCELLKQDEEKLKETLIKLYDTRHNLDHQKNIVERSLTEISKDYNFATLKLDEEFECPTCGQIYENSLAERFALAQDEYRCRDLLSEITNKFIEVENEIASISNQLSETRSRSNSINEILEERQGELKLRDIIQSEGRKEVKTILKKELDSLDSKIGKLEVEISNLEKIMSQYDNKEGRRQIKAMYLDRIKKYMVELSVLKLQEKTFSRLDCVIKETGSDLPRALLAYYFAMLEVISRNSTSTFCPIILDSPKQQDIDEKNWRNMLEFITKYQPSNSQIILSLVDDLGVELGGKYIVLDQKYSLLSEEEFEEVSEQMEPYINACLG